MKKKQENYDPSKPLKNLKHEKLARKIALEPKITQTEAYLEIYPTKNPLTAKSEASDILSKPNVRDRVLALLSKSAGRPILEAVSDRINNHVNQAENLPVSMDACKTVLRVAGAMDDAKQDATSYNPLQINIIIESQKTTQGTDAIDVTNDETNENPT